MKLYIESIEEIKKYKKYNDFNCIYFGTKILIEQLKEYIDFKEMLKKDFILKEEKIAYTVYGKDMLAIIKSEFTRINRRL